MKRFLPILALALALPLTVFGQDLRVNEVMPPTDTEPGWVELYNTSAAAIDASALQLCSFPLYLPLSSLAVVAGDLIVPAGGYLVVEWDASGAQFSDTDGEVGLYVTGPFDNPANMLDYMQYGAAGHTREDVAVDAGLWVEGEFAAVPPAGQTLSYVGDEGADGWEAGAPTPGAENQAPADLGTLRISEVDPREGWVEIQNTGDSDIDAANVWICTRPSYAPLSDLTVVRGSTTLAPGAYLVVEWTPTRDADDDGSTIDGEVGLYETNSFGSADAILDYMAFGAAQSDGREDVAVEAGLWEAGAAAETPPEDYTLGLRDEGMPRSQSWHAALHSPGFGNVVVGEEIGLSVVADGLAAPTALAEPHDGTDRLFVTDQPGQIYIVHPGGETTMFLDIADRMVDLGEGYDERGLLGLAFHPDYASNGRFFVYYSAPLAAGAPNDYDHTSHISEFVVSDDPDVADASSERVVLTVDQPQSNHDAGAIAFGPDGMLYIALGDGGGANDVGTGHVPDWYDFNEGGNGQDVEQHLLGSIVRIDADGAAPYVVPPDNPFVGGDGLDEIFAYGFRNPYRMSFDRDGTYGLIVADAGQDRWEEISHVELGGNYGWNVMEGSHCFDAANPGEDLADCPDTVDGVHPDAGAPLMDPVVEYLNANQDGGIGLVVVGGYVYRGSGVPELTGQYVFGDWSYDFSSPSGRIFTAEPQGEGLWPMSILKIEGGESGELGAFVRGFGEDADGELYALLSQESGPTGATGSVARIVAADDGTPVADEPELPSRVALEANYPNPFNPATTLRFEVPSATHATLAVYDVLGRRIAVLLDAAVPAGPNEVRWNGHDAAGREAPSGVYLYRLTTPLGDAARAMILSR